MSMVSLEKTPKHLQITKYLGVINVELKPPLLFRGGTAWWSKSKHVENDLHEQRPVVFYDEMEGKFENMERLPSGTRAFGLRLEDIIVP
jgi:hypothetical protein